LAEDRLYTMEHYARRRFADGKLRALPIFGNPHRHGATDVRLRGDEPQADQHEHAGQDGEQEATGNAVRQVGTDGDARQGTE
jgi:hypothetical protein